MKSLSTSAPTFERTWAAVLHARRGQEECGYLVTSFLASDHTAACARALSMARQAMPEEYGWHHHSSEAVEMFEGGSPLTNSLPSGHKHNT